MSAIDIDLEQLLLRDRYAGRADYVEAVEEVHGTDAAKAIFDAMRKAGNKYPPGDYGSARTAQETATALFLAAPEAISGLHCRLLYAGPAGSHGK